MLNISLNPGTNKITNISAAEASIAQISLLLLNTLLLNNDFLLFLTLNTCTSSDSASVTNAIVCPTSIFDSSRLKSPIGSCVVPSPIINAASVNPPIIIP